MALMRVVIGPRTLPVPRLRLVHLKGTLPLAHWVTLKSPIYSTQLAGHPPWPSTATACTQYIALSCAPTPAAVRLLLPALRIGPSGGCLGSACRSYTHAATRGLAKSPLIVVNGTEMVCLLLLPVESRSAAWAPPPRGLAHACHSSPPVCASVARRVPGWPAHRWLTAITRLLVMIGHIASSVCVSVSLNERMRGEESTAHAAK